PLGEDPYLQLPPEPRHRPPGQPDAAHARARARRRARRHHRRAHHPPAGRGARGRRMTGVGAALAAAIERLGPAGVPDPRPDAEVLRARALGASRAGIIGGARGPLSPEAAARLERLLARRAAREPVHYLLGEREFWSLLLAVDRRVLIPR